ncbi:PREDICTED: transmembrane protein 104-like isoform X2 [Amphimedon queenslandica]|uniref:Amino acid transporter transmembrane domain-containing protein n=1 Tax=Amphimedon queenslandica TaxID=400682 RepID=A0A1X7VVE9_AMPQE|nr:PREDICTED: transmembrane protein 104-like isoform X2 [Amphimedon queenslandica]|eukprot:XP_011404700.1 PREDICTED: transmembrane protein 104-like isoform X2 [Amphimedon queenslandica]
MAEKGEGRSEKKMGTYSSPIAFAYIFNLIVGAGVLALPQAFNKAGLALGTILLLILCAMSYISASYVIECMAAANAYERMSKRRERVKDMTAQSRKPLNYSLKRRSPSLSKDNGDSLSHSSTEESVSTIPPYCVDVSGVYDPDKKEEQVNITEVTPLMQPSSDSDEDFEIDTKYELGSMATLFYPKVGVALYYLCICLYLCGDLSVYAVIAPASVTRVVCDMYSHYHNTSNGTRDYETENGTDAYSDTYSDACFPGLNKIEIYYIFLLVFILCIGPFTFFNMSKTKLMQITTTILRYLAFMLMISLAFVRIGQGHHSSPKTADFKVLPNLFGVSVYSFMCHHSLPGMVTPMSSKKYIYRILFSDFTIILVFYYLLVFSGVFAFRPEDMKPLYSLDFFNPGDPYWKLVFGIYLALFPVFTLSASFPIISVTLRENLKCLMKLLLSEPQIRGLLGKEPLEADKSIKFPFVIDRFLFPVLALTPPIVIAYATQQIDILVSITGSFPGVGVQYVIPATLVLFAHYKFKKSFGKYKNPYSTPLSHVVFMVIVLGWAGISVVMMVLDLALFPPKTSEPF